MPGFPSQYSKELWQQARDLVAAGMVIREVADRTGISYDALRQKISRENWFVPATALSQAKAVLSQVSQNKTVIDGEEQSIIDQKSQSVTTGVQMAENIEEMGQKSRILALRGLLPRFTKTFTEDSELLSQPIDSWKDAGAMTNILSKLAGWDRPQSTVQVNVWGAGDVQNAIPVEAEPVEDEDP